MDANKKLVAMSLEGTEKVPRGLSLFQKPSLLKGDDEVTQQALTNCTRNKATTICLRL